MIGNTNAPTELMIGNLGNTNAPTELELLEQSFSLGIWGSTVNARDLRGGQAIIRAELPPYMARPWTITLLKQRYAHGNLVVDPVYRGTPDSQVSLDAKVRLTWGVGGVSEVADIDYHTCGNTFVVHASTLMMTAVVPEPPRGDPNKLENYPLFGAYASPSPRSSTSADRGPSATYTSPPATFDRDPSGGGVPPFFTGFQERPSRAIAYRILPDDAGGLTGLVISEYTAGVQSVVQDFGEEPIMVGCTPYIPVAVGQPGERHMYPYREAWIPLHPGTAGLVMATTADDAPTARVQWLLDLG